jgi:hypothetical protein
VILGQIWLVQVGPIPKMASSDVCGAPLPPK